MAMKAGLTSVSFRKLPVGDVIAAAAGAHLAGIEWGGDVHVPPGDRKAAMETAAATIAAGLEVSSYGSYYRAGDDSTPFEAVIEAALALSAPVIRVWAGRRGSADADEAYRRTVVRDTSRIAQMAAGAGVRVAYEFHAGTLTDTPPSARDLLEAVGHEHLGCYWQPVVGQDERANLRSLEMVLPWLANLHVFHWTAGRRWPLAQGAEPWRSYLDLARTTGRPHWAILEFVAGDDPANLPADAATLIDLLAER